MRGGLSLPGSGAIPEQPQHESTAQTFGVVNDRAEKLSRPAGPALRGLSLFIDKGEFVFLIGLSGTEGGINASASVSGLVHWGPRAGACSWTVRICR